MQKTRCLQKKWKEKGRETKKQAEIAIRRRKHEALGKPQKKKKKKELLDRRPKFTTFTPLLMPIEQVLMQIKDDPSLQWLKPISTPAERRDKNKYCRIHQDHGHCTDECRHLKDQVETLIRQGKLQKYVRKTKPYRYQWKDDKDKDREARDSKSFVWEIKTISRGLTAGETLKSLKKAHER